MTSEPTPAEIEAGGAVVVRWLDGIGLPGNLVTAVRPYAIAREVLAAVLPEHDARVRAETAEAIAKAIEAEADAHNRRIAEIAGVPVPRDGMVSFGTRRAAAIARAHAQEAAHG